MRSGSGLGVVLGAIVVVVGVVVGATVVVELGVGGITVVVFGITVVVVLGTIVVFGSMVVVFGVTVVTGGVAVVVLFGFSVVVFGSTVEVTGGTSVLLENGGGSGPTFKSAGDADIDLDDMFVESLESPFRAFWSAASLSGVLLDSTVGVCGVGGPVTNCKSFGFAVEEDIADASVKKNN